MLDNAKDVEERKLIEDTYGVELTGSKVIVTEFVIPMGYAWDGKSPVAMKSGTGFWMGWYIDDNDIPGLDEQRAYPWPVTFAAFGLEAILKRDLDKAKIQFIVNRLKREYPNSPIGRFLRLGPLP